MQLLDGEIVLSATDLVGFLACEHLTQVDRQVALGLLDPPSRDDPYLGMLADKGRAHEARTLARLRAGRWCAEIAAETSSRDGLLAAEAATLAAMRAGVDIVYQATFFDGRWRGHADFLLRVPTSSALGPWSYEVADAKLGHSVKRGARTQLTEYSLQLARLQGRMPELMHIALGNGSWEIVAVADGLDDHIEARRRLEEVVVAPPRSVYPDPVDYCSVCRWADVCAARRRSDGHLSLLPGMWPDHTRLLADAGITSIAVLADAPAEPVDGLTDVQWERHRSHARLQVAERATGRPAYSLLPAAGNGGPAPSPGDLFFDIESEPFGLPGGLEYLFGIVEAPNREPRYRAWWAHTREDERVAFEAVVDFILERMAHDRSLHVFHYATYEVSALRRLAARHATRQEEVDSLIVAGVLVDLYRVVKDSLRISRSSYSLKSLEDFYMPPRDDAVSNAGGSMVAYDLWRRTGDDTVLEGIRIYNERDCLSTLRLRDWLEGRRSELAQSTRHAGLPA
jgi:predicted RecB family nuclease